MIDTQIDGIFIDRIDNTILYSSYSGVESELIA
jgi:hypothetical protein